MNTRIIPRLDIKGPHVVKGIHLEGLRILGKPDYFALKYYQEGADELLYMDIVASLYGRNHLLDMVSQTVKSVFIPLTVGGGVRTLEDIEKLLKAGADKVAINTQAVYRPAFIQEAANTFGSQCIVISIEAKRTPLGTPGTSYEALTHNGRERTGKDIFVWAKEAESLGAGELLLTSVDREGTGQGFDLELIEKMMQHISIPIIVGGGAGNTSHIVDVIQKYGVEAVSAASLFHYDQHPLSSMKSNIKTTDIQTLKKTLKEKL